MRLFSFMCLFLISGFAMAQSPAGFPSPKTNAYYQVGFLRGDSGIIFPSRDTFNARFPTVIHHTNGKYYKTEGGTSPYWSLFADGNATVDTTTRFGGLKTIYKSYLDSTLFTNGLLNTVKRAYDTTIRATQNQTIFVTPYQITDIKNVRVFRNGIDVDISSYMSQEVIIASCDLYDKIKIIQLLKQ